MQDKKKGTTKREQAMELRLKGLTYREIAKLLGGSRQYMTKLLRPSPDIYYLVRARANSCCESCGVPLKNGHMHHKEIKEDKFTHNHPDNLAYLCMSCHKQAHKGDFVSEYQPDTGKFKMKRVRR